MTTPKLALERINKCIDLKEPKLDLSNCELTEIPPEISDLVWLEDLSLSFNEITKIERLNQLRNLKNLDLARNQIRKIEGLDNLKKISLLFLQNNHIGKIEGLDHLKEVSLIFLQNNQIRKIEGLANCKNLSSLFLNDNKIRKIEGLEELKRIILLDLTLNKIIKLEGLGQLNLLSILTLSNNLISKIEGLEKLKSIVSISLNQNQISKIEGLEKLSELDTLDLSNNNIEDLSPLKMFILKGLKISLKVGTWPREKNTIHIFNNPIKNPDATVVGLGTNAILKYWESLEQAQVEKKVLIPINEIKILLIGEGMAGKTSLLKKFKGLDFNERESQTHGVIIEKLVLGNLPLFKNYKNIKQITGRFWDFGGQEIMHSSHQFFLSKRSIYLLIIDSRTDARKEYWLKHIEKYGGESPIIVALNRMDENPNYDVARNTLSKNFKNIGNRFHKISCKTGEGIESFVKEIAELIPEQEMIKTLFNPDWVDIKEQLEKETSQNKYIDQKRFEEICFQHGVDDKTAQNTLLSYLDALGIALHFEKLDLKNFYVLDPHWVTIAIYKIINSNAVERGILKENLLDYILNKEEIKKEEYDPAKEKKYVYGSNEQIYLLKIMEQFELLYEYKNGEYLVPDLLPKEPMTSLDIKDDDEHIHFILYYDFLPQTVMTRFILRMKEDIHNIDHLWRTGVELKNKTTNSMALVTAEMDKNKISICVNGSNKGKREYFAVIHHALSTINRSFNGLIINEKMPVPGYSTIEIDYDDLLTYEKLGKDNYFVAKAGKDFSVSSDFLDKISTPEERRQSRMTSKRADDYEMSIIDQIKTKSYRGATFSDVQPLNSNGDASAFSDKKAPKKQTPFMEKLKKYPFAVLAGILLFLVVFFRLALPGSKVDVFGLFSATQGSSVLENDSNNLSVNKENQIVTIIGKIKIVGKGAMLEDVQLVGIKNNNLVNPVSLSSDQFRLEKVLMPENRLIEIEIKIKNQNTAARMFNLPKPNSNNICDLGDVLIEISKPLNSSSSRPVVIIKNQNVQNNGGVLDNSQ